MLKRISLVIDANLWSDKWEEQMNALEQGLINARGKPSTYPIEFTECTPPEKEVMCYHQEPQSRTRGVTMKPGKDKGVYYCPECLVEIMIIDP